MGGVYKAKKYREKNQKLGKMLSAHSAKDQVEWERVQIG